VKATKVNAGLAESNGRLLPGIWRDSLHVTCGLTACTPGSAQGPTLGNECGKTLPFTFLILKPFRRVPQPKQRCSQLMHWHIGLLAAIGVQNRGNHWHPLTRHVMCYVVVSHCEQRILRAKEITA